MNHLTHGQEIKDTKAMLLTKRTDFTFRESNYSVVVKSSKLPFCKSQEMAMYSTMQVLNSQGKELFLELYPSILNDKLAEKLINKVIKSPLRFVSENK